MLADFQELYAGCFGCIDEHFAYIEKKTKKLGINYTSFGSFDTPMPTIEGKAPAVILNYPTEWVRHYFRLGLQEIDPVVKFAPNARKPFLWADFSNGQVLTPRQISFMQDASAVGMRHGLCVPIRGPFGEASVMSFVTDSAEPLHDPDIIRVLTSLAHDFYVQQMARTREGRPKHAELLSSRELEILKWISQGKSSWDISKIISISENTVNFHVKRIMAKLDTNQRITAIIKAHRLGLIHY